ncbi:hypothetical protein R3X27_19015 [Tropicimonas sp. TH_r6]|uniref:hypothetical protein n=1 Tax=Tropicimonas sp. TH_r6 TaxID=3082085 RepID=UPI002952BF8F|nr:hypothetical protein [Tropicimonas sp. TH_r6]MDV7144778.1 hypothetical protein [Tropicimonas sp. TH_r6]
MSNETLSQFKTLLEEEKALLLSGKIESVAALEPRKQELAQRLETNSLLSSQQLADLQQKVRRNQILLEASSKGFRTASERLKEIRKVMLQLDTYTRGGDMKNIKTAHPKIERRA